MSKKNKDKTRQPPVPTGHDHRAGEPETKNILHTPLPGAPDGVSGVPHSHTNINLIPAPYRPRIALISSRSAAKYIPRWRSSDDSPASIMPRSSARSGS